MVDINLILAITSLVTSFGSVLLVMYKFFTKIDKLEIKTETCSKDTEVLLKSQLGVLEGLIENGLNGPCKKARDELIAYMAKHEE